MLPDQDRRILLSSGLETEIAVSRTTRLENVLEICTVRQEQGWTSNIMQHGICYE